MTDNQSTGKTNPKGVSNDPTENVKALSEAANKRQDDLREAGERLTRHDTREVGKSLHFHIKYIKELMRAESRRVDEQAQLRADYAKELSVAESKRIDAIRLVDVNAVAVASQRASDQATVLANQVAQSAEALRSLVASTANTVAQSQQTLANTLSTRITTLEQAGYQAQGKSSFSDPAFTQLLDEVKQLRGTKSEGISLAWAAMLAVAGLVLGVGVYYAAHQSTSPAAQPQVVYLPSPQAVPPANIIPPAVR